MDKSGPIVVIEDDPDDQSLLQELFKELQLLNEVVIITNGLRALDYLRQPQVKPFLVISDINMPGMNGFALRKEILADVSLSIKCLPFIFCTTGASPAVVNEAYANRVQGIFQKPSSYHHWKKVLSAIVQYWTLGVSPGS